MEKTKINVIDLDQTLIPYDSYTNYLNRLKSNYLFILPGILLVILRKIRIISIKLQKKYCIILNKRIDNYQNYIKNYSDQLFNDINAEVLKIVNEKSDNSTINILCTASPYDYANLLANKLGWKCIASHFTVEDHCFIHIYGKNKVYSLNKLYPKNVYNYNFAISDAKSDLYMLKQFNSSILYKNDNN